MVSPLYDAISRFCQNNYILTLLLYKGMSRILPIPTDDRSTVPRSALELLLDMVRPYRWQTAAFLFLSVFGVITWAVQPLLVADMVTELSRTRQLSSQTVFLIVLYFVLQQAYGIAWRLLELIMRGTKPQMVESVRWRLFSAVLRRPYTFFTNSSSGRIGYWINQVADTTSTFIDLSVWSAWNQILTLIISAAFLLATHWSLALLFAVWMAALFAFNIHRGREFSRLVSLVGDEESKASGLVVDALGNHVSVRAFGGEAAEREALLAQQYHIVRAWRRSWLQNFFTNVAKQESVAIVTTAALLIVVLLYANGIIPLGSIVLFVAYFGSASAGLWELAWAIDNNYRNYGMIKNALDGLQGEEERPGTSLPSTSQTPSAAELSLESVSFAYPEKPDVMVLDQLSLHVAPKERVGIVGHSGAGKSTIVGLLLGFYEPLAGTIAMNGQTTAEYGPRVIRERSSYVPQDTSLFNRTVRENVAYAKPGATDEEIIDALTKAQAMEFVGKLPDGLDSVIGERGVKLSGGQRQRIAIARAILQDAPLLILDEATSALDSVSEQAIQKALFELMQHRTAIVIAHRLSTLRNMDRIVVIDEGKIVEQGTHDQLVHKRGIYADLWKRQKDGFVAD